MDMTMSSSVPLGAGAAFALAPEKVELIGEVFGAVAVGEHHGFGDVVGLIEVIRWLTSRRSSRAPAPGQRRPAQQRTNPGCWSR